MAIDPVIFDMDGVLIDSEPTWTEVRRRFVLAERGRWPSGAAEAMQGMATTEWAGYLHGELERELLADDIAVRVIDAMASAAGSSPPLMPGAVAAVRRWPALAARPGLVVSGPAHRPCSMPPAWPAPSRSPCRPRRSAGASRPPTSTWPSPAGWASSRCGAAVEDSTNGLRAALAAGMHTIAVPFRSRTRPIRAYWPRRRRCSPSTTSRPRWSSPTRARPCADRPAATPAHVCSTTSRSSARTSRPARRSTTRCSPPLGGERIMDFGEVIGYGVAGPARRSGSVPEAPETGFRESHIAFRGPQPRRGAGLLRGRGEVRRRRGAPRAPRVAEYHPNYYGAFVRDPDGNNVEAVCHTGDR